MDKRRDKKAESKTGGGSTQGSTSEKTGLSDAKEVVSKSLKERPKGECQADRPCGAPGTELCLEGFLRTERTALQPAWSVEERRGSPMNHMVLPDAHSSSGSLHSSVLLTCIREIREERVGNCVALRRVSRHCRRKASVSSVPDVASLLL